MNTYERRYLRFSAGVAALTLLTIAGLLASIALLPALAGWRPVAVLSDSMRPAFLTGDVILFRPEEPQRLVGAVVLFEDASGMLITHRVIGVASDGRFITKGDANAQPDASLVEAGAVLGSGRVLVPWVGLPVAWVGSGGWLRLIALVCALASLGWVARWGVLPEYDPWLDERPTPKRSRRWRWAAAAGAVILFVPSVVGTAQAAWAATTDSLGNSLLTSVTFPTPTIRVTTYELTGPATSPFSGATYSLALQQALASDYIVLVNGAAGAGTSNGNRGVGSNTARVSGDPHGNFATVTAPDRIQLTRGATTGRWQGQITVIESLSDSGQSGFALVEVLEVTLSGSAVTGSGILTSAWSSIDRVGAYGGPYGGGASTTNNQSSDHNTVWGRVYPAAAPQRVVIERAGGAPWLNTATFTVYLVEWGSEWTIQRVTVTGSAGGPGVDQTTEFDTAALAVPVIRNETFLLAYGNSTDNGIGDGYAGTVWTLGDGVTQNASESTVAVGAEYNDPRTTEVYVHTHPGLRVDHRFGPDGGTPGIPTAQLSGAVTVDAAAGSESYVTVGQVRIVNGHRFATVAGSSNGTGTAFPRPMVWARPTASTQVTWSRSRSGQPGAFWMQSIDFATVRP